MPHTSNRKKTQRNKRAEILDDDGWTRVTTTSIAHRSKPSVLPARDAVEAKNDRTTTRGGPSIAEAATDMTLDTLRAQYDSIERIWLKSESWREIKEILSRDSYRDGLAELEQCVMFGSGSFSGLVQGWISREAPLHQLAAFMAIVNLIGHITGRKRPTVKAQEPLYNKLDVEFLIALQVETVSTPTGFKSLTPNSFVYAPGAEFFVQERSLVANPTLYMGNGSLDDYWRNDKGQVCTNRVLCGETMQSYHELADDSELRRKQDAFEMGLGIQTEFMSDKDGFPIVEMEAKDRPFHGLHVFVRRSRKDELG